MKLKYEKLLPRSSIIKNCILFMHGLGDTPAGFGSLFKHLQTSPETAKIFENTVIILPYSPKQAVTANGGYVMPSWFDIKSFNSDEPKRYGLDQYTKSLEMVTDLVSDVQQEYQIENGKFIIGGFSQGGSLSLSSNLFMKEKIGGVICLSGFNVWDSPSNPQLVSYLEQLSPEAKNIPVFHGTGDSDPLISLKRATDTKEFFTKTINSLNAENYSFNIYEDVAHHTDPEELSQMSEFVNKVFN
jgi:phospholipase/carboxylesterase